MSFEMFTRMGRGNKPALSIRKNGQFGLNSGAIEKFKLVEYGYVVLYFDKARKMIGLRPTVENEEYAQKLIVKKDCGSIGGKAFLDFYEIPYGEKVRKFELKWDESEKMMVAIIREK
ncbi:MAG: hypothetical protein OEV59_10080 [Deltaproteobacteria bacterium]|nr:hypothetical protein [Deltaproteobacteria bacterium]